MAILNPLRYTHPNVCFIQPGKWETAVGLQRNLIISEVSQWVGFLPPSANSCVTLGSS